MNAIRAGLFCALVGWMAAGAQAQSGTYGSPDLIPLGQYAPRGYYVPAVASHESYVAVDDSAGSNLPPSRIPPPPSESAAVSSMLNEPGPTVGPSSGCSLLPPGGYIKAPGNCETGDVRGGFGCGGAGGCCSPWFVSVDALYMTRNQPNNVFTSYNASNADQQGCFNEANWTWGEQATIGYRFGCNCEWAVQGTYWGLTESNTNGTPGNFASYSTPMTFGLTYMLGTTGGTGPDGAQAANEWTDNSPYHHVWLNWDVQDVEFNLVRKLVGDDCNCNRFAADFLVGIRWFRFQDGFLWGAQRGGSNNSNPNLPGYDPYAGDMLYLDDRITNDLIGPQIGFNASYRFADCWRFFITPELGIYNNHMTLDYNVYAVGSTNGKIYQGTSGTYANPNYPVHDTTDGLSFLTQVDLGLDWQICQHVSTQFGYRVLAMTGMGLSGSQIPQFANDTQAIADIKHNDSLVVHGVFGGLTFCW